MIKRGFFFIWKILCRFATRKSNMRVLTWKKIAKSGVWLSRAWYVMGIYALGSIDRMYYGTTKHIPLFSMVTQYELLFLFSFLFIIQSSNVAHCIFPFSIGCQASAWSRNQCIDGSAWKGRQRPGWKQTCCLYCLSPEYSDCVLLFTSHKMQFFFHPRFEFDFILTI